MGEEITRDKDVINYKILGKRINERRRALKMTQSQLSEKIGITPESMSRIETGKIGLRLSTLGDMSIALSCSIEYLVAGTVRNTTDYMDNELSQYTPDEKELMCDMMELVNKYVESKKNEQNKEES